MGEQNAIKIQQLEENGVVYLRFELNIPPKDNAKYAFYFFHNNTKIDVRWYSDSLSCKFQVNDQGLYHVAAFAKYNECNPAVYTSQPHQVLFPPKAKNNSPKTSISIWGSCVSRDFLEYKNVANLELIHYIARQSIVSAVSKPLQIKEDDIHLSSSFQRKQVLNDFNKLSFDMLCSKKAEYLIVDLVDERFQLAKYYGSYITYSQECKNSGLLSEDTLLINKKRTIADNGKVSYCVEDNNLDCFMDIFCNLLLSIYTASRIILHRVYGAEYFVDAQNEIKRFDENTISRLKYTNALYEYMYEYMYNRLGKSICNIDISKGYYASEQHKWGLAPIHFQHEYYKEVGDMVNSYIQSQMEDLST